MCRRQQQASKREGRGRGRGLGRQSSFTSTSQLYKSLLMIIGSALSLLVFPLLHNSRTLRKYKYQPQDFFGKSSSQTQTQNNGHLQEIYNYNQNGFCHHWDQSVANNRSLQPFDMWFTHHPTWVVTNETDEQFCVERGNIHDHPHIYGFMQFYANQFHSSCDRVHVRNM